MGVEQKVALVTGAGFGVGRAAAFTLASKGHKVFVFDPKLSAAEETVALIRAAGNEATASVFDATTTAGFREMVQTVVETYGALHYAVNNFASDSDYRRLHEIDEDGWNRAIDTMLKSIWLSMKFEIPALKDSGGGAIVNVTSAAGINPSPGLAALGAARAGVINLTRSAAAEVAEDGIRVNSISPGGVMTDRLARLCRTEEGLEQPLKNAQPFGRLAEPGEIAACISFLCSDDSSFMSGDNMVVDGGGGVMSRI